MMGPAYRQTPRAMIAVLTLLGLIFYSGNCFAGENIEWMKFDELARAYKGHIKLEEEESVKNVRAALVRLREGTARGGVDALLVYNFNSCGTGGCPLTIFLRSPEGVMEEVFSVSTGGGIDDGGHFYVGLSLGNGYTKGMRNLRFNDSVTWVWNGQSYDLK